MDRQLATSSSGQNVDTDSLRPPSIVVPDPSRTRSLLDELADVGLASRRALGDDGCSTAVGLVQARPFSSGGVTLFSQAQRKGVMISDCSRLPFATQDPAL
jgi:hypothetical protein